jgi:hypothetical protein
VTVDSPQYAPAVERLGIAVATWNPELVRRSRAAVSKEVRAMRARDDRVGLNVWSPTVNPLRLPLWGRDEEGPAIVDRTRTAADAVTPARDAAAELVYRICDFGTGVSEARACWRCPWTAARCRPR